MSHIESSAAVLRSRPVAGAAARSAALATCLAAFLSLGGCKSAAAPAATDDSSLTNSVRSALSADSALGSQPIQTSVQNGVVSLNGTVSDPTSRSLAGRDAASVAGVRTVLNNLVVQSNPSPSNSAMMTPAPMPAPAPPTRTIIVQKPSPMVERNRYDNRQRNSQNSNPNGNQPQPPNTGQNTAQNQPPVQNVPQSAPQPPSPPVPTFRDVTLPAGSTIPVRITQTLDSASTQQGQAFSGAVATDLLADGLIAIPQGSAVSGRVDAVQDAGHFSGNSLLSISLSSVTRRGEHIAVATEPFTKQGNGRGRNTAEKVGGGAAVGAILGGIFGGGRGAAIGAAAGGATGAGANAITRGQQVQIPSETVVRFRLTNPITVRVRNDGGSGTRARTGAEDNNPGNNNPGNYNPGNNNPSNNNAPPSYGNRTTDPNNGDPTLNRRPQ